jgi:hypothetical protein
MLAAAPRLTAWRDASFAGALFDDARFANLCASGPLRAGSSLGAVPAIGQVVIQPREMP